MNIVITDPSADKLLKELADTNAIKILFEDEDLSQSYEIAEWQKEEVKRRIEAFRKNPNDIHSWEEIEKMLIEDEKV